MDDFVDKTMANLKLIGMIKKGEKVCLKKGQLNIEQIDRLQSFRRWYNKDSRDVSLTHIRNTINDAIKIAKGIIGNTVQMDLKTWTIAALNSELRNCETGLLNLKTTYMEDQSFLANIEVLQDKCRAQCDEIDKSLFSMNEASSSPTTSMMSMNGNDSTTVMKRTDRTSRHMDRQS
jgi:hypothetical protein